MNIASAIQTDLVQDYRRAWNVHDAAAVADLFAVGGTYVDPSLDGPVRGDGIAALANQDTELRHAVTQPGRVAVAAAD